jgi:hypothetical protein
VTRSPRSRRLVAGAGCPFTSTRGGKAPLRRTLWSTASRSPAAECPRRSRACSTVRPAGNDLERPSTITVTEAPRSSSPPSATAIRAAISHSSSHARRVSRSLVVERKGVRKRPRGAPRDWWSWVELVGACSNGPHGSGEVRSAPKYYKERTAGKLHLLRANTLTYRIGSKPRGSDRQLRELIGPCAHAPPKPARRAAPDGAWAVPDDRSADPLPPRPGMPSGMVGHPAQVRSSNTTIRSDCRTQ